MKSREPMTKVIDLVDDLKRLIQDRDNNDTTWRIKDLRKSQIKQLKADIIGQIQNEELD